LSGVRAAAAGVLAAAWLLAAPASAACGGPEAPCEVSDGRYYVAQPAARDDAGPRPAVIFFHGYRSGGDRVIGNVGLREAVTGAGYLLVAPDGLEGTWAHVGSPSGRRDELAFLDQVRADLLARWNVDPRRLLVAGFSQGGSMVWDLACYRGGDYTAFAAIAGGFWEPLPASCDGAPVRLWHVHGWADEVVPLEGRPIREVFRQGDIVQGFTLWRRHNGCTMPPDRRSQTVDLSCRGWTACEGGRLRLCLHDGGHRFEAAWVADAIRWMERTAPD